MMCYISADVGTAWEIRVGPGAVLPGLNPACAMSSWAELRNLCFLICELWSLTRLTS